MAVWETEIKKMRQEMLAQFQDMRKLLLGQNIIGKWVNQDTACATLNIGKRRLADIRIHLDKNNTKVGCIRWRKGKGKSIQYYKADIESYLNQNTIS